MAKSLNDNFRISAGKPIDSKYLNSSNSVYTGTSQVLSQIPLAERFVGLTVNINNEEYWFKTGVTTASLIKKNDADFWKVSGTTTLKGNVTISGGFRTTFSPTSTIIGLNVGSTNTEPSSGNLVNGDLWYHPTGKGFMLRNNGYSAAIVHSRTTNVVGNSIPFYNSSLFGELTTNVNLISIDQPNTALKLGGSSQDGNLRIGSDLNRKGNIISNSLILSGNTGVTLTVKTGVITSLNKHVFTPSASQASVNIGSRTSDPTGLTNYDIWGRSDLNKIRARINGSSINLATENFVTGLTNFNVSNGLTKTSNHVRLGGTITGDTTITLNSSTTTFKILDTNSDAALIASPTLNQLVFGAGDLDDLVNDYCLYTATGSIASIGSGTAGGETVSFNIDAGSFGCKFQDGRSIKKGIEYDGNYSSGFTKHSLVDKNFTTGLTNQVNIQIITSTSFTANTNTHFIHVSGNSASNIYLPSSPKVGQQIYVSDAKGNAFTNAITVRGNGKLINGSSTALIDSDYGTIMFVYNGINWIGGGYTT